MKSVKKSAAKKTAKKAAPKMMAKPSPKMMQASQQEAPMMKMGGKMPKAQFGKAMQNIGSKLTSATPLGILAGKEAVNGMFGLNKPAAPANSMMKKGGAVKAKKGGSFPDLNKDGKITKADVLIGRGVVKPAKKTMKSGGTMKKCKSGCY